MKQITFNHPYPRYGFAAALVNSAYYNSPEHLKSWEDIKALALEALKDGLNKFSLFTKDNPEQEGSETLRFRYVPAEVLSPGKANGQVAATGYYIAPHIITSDGSAANTKGETDALIKALEKCDKEEVLFKPTDLKRSFAPLTTKVNNGSKSAQNPKASLRDAAFTCIATLTAFKPAVYAAYKKGSFANAAVIPDLPLYGPQDSYPLLEYIQVLKEMLYTQSGEAQMEAKINLEKKGFVRPNLHKGNYPNAPTDRNLNAVSLVAAIGEWYKQNKDQAPKAKAILQVLENLQGRPLYIVSYEFARQERFQHGLVTLAKEHHLPSIQKAVWKSKIYGVDKLDDPKRQLFHLAFTHFLQLYSPTEFHNFLSFRAEYPNELSPVFDHYFQKVMEQEQLSQSLVKSARAYGQSLNNAAYQSAHKKVVDDKKQNRTGLSLDEYKARVLTELESRVLSAKSKAELLGQISITVGRMTGKDFFPEAGTFMEEVLTEHISLKQAQNLITAFMRLRSSFTKAPSGEEVLQEDAESLESTIDTVLED